MRQSIKKFLPTAVVAMMLLPVSAVVASASCWMSPVGGLRSCDD
jgi:hypothetical protein